MEKKSLILRCGDDVNSLAAGEFDAALPTTIMVSAFFSLLSPRSFERLVVEGQMSAEEVASDLGRIYFKGIIAN